MKNLIKIMQNQLVVQSNHGNLINNPLNFQGTERRAKKKKYHEASLLVSFYFVVQISFI